MGLTHIRGDLFSDPVRQLETTIIENVNTTSLGLAIAVAGTIFAYEAAKKPQFFLSELKERAKMSMEKRVEKIKSPGRRFITKTLKSTSLLLAAGITYKYSQDVPIGHAMIAEGVLYSSGLGAGLLKRAIDKRRSRQ
jgi:hypothetical protein